MCLFFESISRSLSPSPLTCAVMPPPPPPLPGGLLGGCLWHAFSSGRAEGAREGPPRAPAFGAARQEVAFGAAGPVSPALAPAPVPVPPPKKRAAFGVVAATVAAKTVAAAVTAGQETAADPPWRRLGGRRGGRARVSRCRLRGDPAHSRCPCRLSRHHRRRCCRCCRGYQSSKGSWRLQAHRWEREVILAQHKGHWDHHSLAAAVHFSFAAVVPRAVLLLRSHSPYVPIER